MSENLSAKVMDIMYGCLFKSEELEGVGVGEVPEGTVLAEGVMLKVGFHPSRLEASRDEVKSILDEMHPTFHKDGGGGWSFLNLCEDKHGTHWAEHATMDALVTLGIALGMVSFTMPREMWDVLPGGMPYLVIDTEKKRI